MYSELSKLVAGGRLHAVVRRRLLHHNHQCQHRRRVSLTTPSETPFAKHKTSTCSFCRHDSGRQSRSTLRSGSYCYENLLSITPSINIIRSFHAAPLPSQRLSGATLAPQGLSAASFFAHDGQEDGDCDHELLEEMELSQQRHLPDNMWSVTEESISTTAFRHSASLDLELGEGSIWDNDRNRMEDDQWGDQEETYEESDNTDDYWDVSRSQENSQLEKPQRGANNSSVHRSAMELLMHFDPQTPPISDDPDDLQLWLECEAQQEAVLRYQKVIEKCRERKDYSSLSLVQQQVLRWFQPLQEEIASRQRQYIYKKGSQLPAAQRYGPYLCALPPAKLAVIAAHEAIMHCLLKSGLHGREGVPFVSIAKRLGEAVEEEILIQRVLHKRFKDKQQSRNQQQSEMDRDIADLVSVEHNGTVDENDSGSTASSVELEPQEEEKDAVDVATHNWSYTSSHLQNYMDEISKYKPSAKKRRVVAYALRRARHVLEKDELWTTADKIQLGAALFQVLLNHATVFHDGKEEMAFMYEKRWLRKNKLKSFVQLNERLYRMIVSDKLKSLSPTTTRHKPMIRPPLPWTATNKGGYLWVKTDLMRHHGCKTQEEALQNAEMTTVFDGLNALGRVPWKINRSILEVAQKCWDDNIPLGDIPSQKDFEVPPEPMQPEAFPRDFDKEGLEYKHSIEEWKRYRDALHKYNRFRQKNMDLRSLRCSAMLKLDQAEKFKEFEEIYFPYNMDFRGRAYPVPPHLSNVGSDLCRGILMFADAKPLGRRGLFWLKVHLANFAGMNKISFDDRAAFVDENIDKVRDSAENPFSGDKWWMVLEDPFQGLSACMEIINAIDSGDPESYRCALPVHQDGSCNGLQHYAAMGRDPIGGRAVNLCATEEPQDVYLGTTHEVQRRVAEEAERMLDFDETNLDVLDKNQKKALANNRAAKLVNGLIDRSVVKRTVMTSVYGVTYIGARNQIQEKIEEKLEAKGYDIDQRGSHEIFLACGYLANVTMSVMGDYFTCAETMNWLTTCARLITQHGYPVAWMSPIGVPAIQPYRQKSVSTIVTLLQTVTVTDGSDDLPIHKKRQVTAFPPNYIHSLDTSHMLLTALEMDRRGLTFSAVHDSFWTHACDVDEMNQVLRDTFVDLYDKPMLESLKKTWEMRYPDLDFPDLPERGDLDLNEVRNAKYFFQ